MANTINTLTSIFVPSLEVTPDNLSKSRGSILAPAILFFTLTGFFLQISAETIATLKIFSLCLAATTDWLDGWLARRRRCFSEFGWFIDRIHDKLLILSSVAADILIASLLKFEAQTYFYVITLLFLMETVLFHEAVSAKKKNLESKSNEFGKVKVALEYVAGLFVCLAVFYNENFFMLATMSYALALLLAIMSLIFHVRSS